MVTVLLELFHLQDPFLDDADMECSDDSSVDNPRPRIDAVCDIKKIITKLSSKKPELILSILKTVLEMIEVNESTKSNEGIVLNLSFLRLTDMCYCVPVI